MVDCGTSFKPEWQEEPGDLIGGKTVAYVAVPPAGFGEGVLVTQQVIDVKKRILVVREVCSVSLEAIREALRKLPPDQLRQLLAEFSDVLSASDREDTRS